MLTRRQSSGLDLIRSAATIKFDPMIARAGLSPSFIDHCSGAHAVNRKNQVGRIFAIPKQMVAANLFSSSISRTDASVSRLSLGVLGTCQSASSISVDAFKAANSALVKVSGILNS
ncbi:MAG: hypothetical protein HY852_16530 [Bradyrhizobium sp.]|uniref:hypothetical protein n=1 Tax=Bradyrhizobium sp. TaxID=376 RepID=UPI0025C493D4|nr:hypothetical protein [Bradyrhizobium sp.]MBI5263417.1 hypothetical protein [Bradyrhizobium sp.]